MAGRATGHAERDANNKDGSNDDVVFRRPNSKDGAFGKGRLRGSRSWGGEAHRGMDLGSDDLGRFGRVGDSPGTGGFGGEGGGRFQDSVEEGSRSK